MMKGMASGNMPNLPGMPNMAGMSGRAARKLAQQGAAGLPAAPAGADFDMLSQLMGDSGDLDGESALFPGLPASATPRPTFSGNKGTKKKKKGGRATPPKSR